MQNETLYKQSRLLTYLLLACLTAPFLLLLKGVELSNTPLFMITLGSIVGFMGVGLLFFQLLLGLRFLIPRFSRDLVWYNQLHQKTGIYGVVFIFLHPFLKAYTYFGSIKYALLPDFTDPFWIEVSFGRIAFFLLLILWITSAIFRRRLGFRLWKYIHFIAYLVLFFVFLHAPVIGTYLNTYPILMMYWNFLSYLFYFIVIYRLFKFLGFGYSKYKLVQKEHVGEVFIYTFECLDNCLKPKTGQFCFIKPSKYFGEEHPFTVMNINQRKKQLVFGIKTLGKFTKDLSKLEPGKTILIEGPYGVYTIEGQTKVPKVLIAGGIGITPFVRLIDEFGDNQTYLFYCNKTLNKAVLRKELKSKLGNNYIDVISDEKVTENNVIYGSLNAEGIKKYVSKHVVNSALYFICGSEGFYNYYKKMLLDMGISKNAIYYEEFGF